MYWANFLHIYQPPTQRPSILKRVVEESYRRILAELKCAPEAKLTLNIPGCLTELLAQYGYADVICDIRELLEKGRIELTGTAKYHPLLPKMPAAEIVRQILLDGETNRHYFGESYNPQGFFPPEAAYDRRLAEIVAGLGFKWILAEELSYKGKFGEAPRDRICKIANGLLIFFRERQASFRILSGQLGTVKLFEDHFAHRLDLDEYLLTAMDGETFGHHRPGMEKLLFEIYKSRRLKTVTISELIRLFPKREAVETVPSTWALMEKDLEKNAPFSRWDDPGNEIQKKQWELTKLAIDSVNNSKFTTSSCHARQLLDKALHSDQYWWASARPWWSLEMIEAGANELREAVQIVPDASAAVKKKARQLYYEIITTGFSWQRSGMVEELSRREDEEVRERTDERLPKLPKTEVEKMMANIRGEMLAMAGKEEYERAAQLRDRIRELGEYLSKE